MLPTNVSIDAGLSVYTDMSFNIAPYKKLSKGVKTHDLGGQFTGPEGEIKCSPNSPLNKSIVMRAVACSFWNHMLVKPSSCILQIKFCISSHGCAHHSQLRYDLQHLWGSTVQWSLSSHTALNCDFFCMLVAFAMFLADLHSDTSAYTVSLEEVDLRPTFQKVYSPKILGCDRSFVFYSSISCILKCFKPKSFRNTFHVVE